MAEAATATLAFGAGNGMTAAARATTITFAIITTRMRGGGG